MIPRVHKQGTRTIGLLHYLYGPGTHEEHTDPHLVASWDDGLAPDPGRNPAATLADLAQLLDQPLALVDDDQRPSAHVWHCSVRAAKDDPLLTDEQWGHIARRVIAATGIDPDDEGGCRWAAVRHADDHIHLIATLVREDGRRPNHHRSGQRAQAECRLIEAEYDLHRVNPGDGTSAPRPTSAERHKAHRRGQTRTAREQLRDTVRRAATGASTEQEFFDRLTATGLLVRQRVAPSGDLLGYTVALPDDRNKDGEPVYYSGSKLAPDLSLPRIRERFADADPDAGTPTHHPGPQAATPAATARRNASQTISNIAQDLNTEDDGTAAAHIAEADEVLNALTMTSAGHTYRELRDAAATFERASRSHIRAEFQHARALHRAARDLVYSGKARDHGEDAGATAMVIDSLIFFVIATVHWHVQRHHAQQAAAARQTAEFLRAAYRNASAGPLHALRTTGQHLPAATTRHTDQALRSTLPDYADRIQSEPNWPALAATLHEAEQVGYDSSALLHWAAAQREVDTVDSLSDVLLWRIRRHTNLPAAGTAPAPRRQARRPQPPTPPTGASAANPSSKRQV